MSENDHLDNFEDLWGDRRQVLNSMIGLYERTGQKGKEVLYLHQTIVASDISDKLSHCCFMMGLSMEKLEKYRAAALFYSRAVLLEHRSTFVMYFIHNNLGYCLNILGNYEEAEKVCRKAITIDRGRPNAYKNLGISLESQERYEEAAAMYKAGMVADTFDNDPRPRQYLRRLLSRHPEISMTIPNDRELREARKKFTADSETVEGVQLRQQVGTA
jgi:tetratricopeptide (TPR) repeat protein